MCLQQPKGHCSRLAKRESYLEHRAIVPMPQGPQHLEITNGAHRPFPGPYFTQGRTWTQRNTAEVGLRKHTRQQ
jgi:hypothetical protein